MRLQVFLIGVTTIAASLAAYFGAWAVLREFTHTRLDGYAAQLVAQGHSVLAEADSIIDEAAETPFPACSDRDLGMLRSLVFGARFIRDVERVDQGRVICTSGMGAVQARDLVRQQATATMRTGDALFAETNVVSAAGHRALIVLRNQVGAVIDPRGLEYAREAPMYFALHMLGERDGTMVRGFGDEMRLSFAQLRTGGRLEQDGSLYSAICLAPVDVCAVARVSLADAARREQPLAMAFGGLGGLAGAGAGLAGVLALRRRQEMPALLRRCLRRDELTLVYQPIVDLNSGRMVSAEALVRWYTEDGKAVRPDVFVALAEEMGLISEITNCVIRIAAAEMVETLRRFDVRIGLNIAAADLQDRDLPDRLHRHFVARGVPASRVSLELTERSSAARDNCIAAIARLRERGHLVYIDDFGTGYSSLSYLHELAVDVIKLDKSFTDTIGTGAVTASVVPQILAMAQSLKLGVIVEGVETEAQESYLRAQGVRYVQGWRYGKPMRAADLMARIAAEAAAATSPDGRRLVTPK